MHLPSSQEGPPEAPSPAPLCAGELPSRPLLPAGQHRLPPAVTLCFSGAPSPSQRPEPQEPIALHASGQAGHEPALAAKVHLGSWHQTRRHQ